MARRRSASCATVRACSAISPPFVSMPGVASTPERALVINADDFGLSEGVNRGVLAAFDAGALRSASIMVTMPAFDDAVRGSRVAGREQLGIGLHLTLTAGRPLTRAQSLTTHGTGEFCGPRRLLARAARGHVDLRDVAEECQ